MRKKIPHHTKIRVKKFYALQSYHHRPFYDTETVKEWATFLVYVDGRIRYLNKIITQLTPLIRKTRSTFSQQDMMHLKQDFLVACYHLQTLNLQHEAQ